MTKVLNKFNIMNHLSSGMTVMIGGFMAVGTPEGIVDVIIENEGIKDLTVIANDTGLIDKGIGKLVVKKLIKKTIVSHIGTNPETGKQMNNGELEVELVPQGTMVERIRCAGAGLGGFLTPTGVGTIVEEGKKVITIDGKSYLLELPLRAEVALIKAWKADTYGNLVYRRSSRNFNPIMAMAADLVIVEAEEIVDKGILDPNEVMTPGLLVDIIVQGEK